MCSPAQKFVVRLPSELHTQVKRIAKQENRSMNNEIVNRLERSLAPLDDHPQDEKLIAILLNKIATLEQQIQSLQVAPTEAER
ncbi:Arc family DNA-binding protein [Pseudomonas protegens]|uniref:Arc family DNA-binding protein n=1 Tax=Pseudomonas protegens TaxID=380021 RepID=UPI001C8D6F0F|nr:Arc family DNA-binding protein [Pseudomonas protegens]QZI72804.1 Arc family DNA-binding protein [Pseudomonas protegens]WOE77472.1 Arc family DNA-binding protein [Pseudomonas protegens]